MIKAAKGVTLIEIAVIIAIMAVLTGFGTLAWTGLGESRDASMIQAAQANLQTVITQGTARMDRSPTWLYTNNTAGIQNAMNALLQDTAGNNTSIDFIVSPAGTATLSIVGSGRTATYTITNEGNVQLTGLAGSWSQYGVQNGVIRKL